LGKLVRGRRRNPLRMAAGCWEGRTDMEVMTRTCNPERLIVERWLARLLVAFGAIFWFSMVMGAQIAYLDNTLPQAARNEWITLVLLVVILAIAWFYELVATAILYAGAVATVVWGIIAGWELGVWAVMGSLFIAPALIAGTLFLAASRMQQVCLLEQKSA
jgi:hypothetical protein